MALIKVRAEAPVSSGRLCRVEFNIRAVSLPLEAAEVTWLELPNTSCLMPSVRVRAWSVEDTYASRLLAFASHLRSQHPSLLADARLLRPYLSGCPDLLAAAFDRAIMRAGPKAKQMVSALEQTPCLDDREQDWKATYLNWPARGKAPSLGNEYQQVREQLLVHLSRHFPELEGWDDRHGCAVRTSR